MGLDMRGVRWLESPMLTDDRGHVYNGEDAARFGFRRVRLGLLSGFGKVIG